MDERLVLLVDKVEYEGLDYALTKWSDWTDLKEDFSELYSHIYMYRYFSEWLENKIEELKKELENES